MPQYKCKGYYQDEGFVGKGLIDANPDTDLPERLCTPFYLGNSMTHAFVSDLL
uniref:Uncharacterized protein n=1 Tax=Arundo donax TaxID=35708 RepID=A0A0A9BZC6_ARUDO